MVVQIRDAVETDKNALTRMMVGLNTFENQITGDRLTDPENAAKHVDYLKKTVREDGGCVLVAELDGDPIGFLVAFREEDDGFYLKPDAKVQGYISDLFVEEAARGKGVARSLMLEAEKRFRDMGITRMLIGALTANVGALTVYEKHGYSRRTVFLERDI